MKQKVLSKKEIKIFFNKIDKLKLSDYERKRMLELFQVRGSNQKNKVMTYKDFILHLRNNKGRITSLVLGPKWSRLVFVDINIEV